MVKELVIVKPEDIQQEYNKKAYIPFAVREAVGYILGQYPKFQVNGREYESCLCLEPHLINPFLRCMEAMGERVKIELDYTFKREPFYRIKECKSESLSLGNK